jgi:hypothetical protein
MGSAENTILPLLYPIAACAVIGVDHAENTISLLLFTGRCLTVRFTVVA